MAIPYPNRRTTFQDGMDLVTGTPAVGSTFQGEFDQFYANDNSLDATMQTKQNTISVTPNRVLISDPSGNVAASGTNSNLLNTILLPYSNGALPVAGGAKLQTLWDGGSGGVSINNNWDTFTPSFSYANFVAAQWRFYFGSLSIGVNGTRTLGYELHYQPPGTSSWNVARSRQVDAYVTSGATYGFGEFDSYLCVPNTLYRFRFLSSSFIAGLNYPTQVWGDIQLYTAVLLSIPTP